MLKYRWWRQAVSGWTSWASWSSRVSRACWGHAGWGCGQPSPSLHPEYDQLSNTVVSIITGSLYVRRISRFCDSSETLLNLWPIQDLEEDLMVLLVLLILQVHLAPSLSVTSSAYYNVSLSWGWLKPWIPDRCNTLQTICPYIWMTATHTFSQEWVISSSVIVTGHTGTSPTHDESSPI